VLAALANPNIKVYCVDLWLGDSSDQLSAAFSTWLRHTQYFPNIIPIQVNLSQLDEGPRQIANMEGISLEELTINVLFVDGDHSYDGVMTDLMLYAPYAKKACGHNFIPHDELERAVYTYYSKGWRKSLNTLYSKVYLIAHPRLRRWMRLSRSKFLDKHALKPKFIDYHTNDKSHHSIWYTKE